MTDHVTPKNERTQNAGSMLMNLPENELPVFKKKVWCRPEIVLISGGNILSSPSTFFTETTFFFHTGRMGHS
ncbi:hypothetical protein [Mucilaginibacter jinjuensis]|uniref:Uncharacterized protein n=1 Tax=Mucilaginibacter jinjuensis TaxID=1176721 RepID=A0ABY7TBL7_9SPHI|nr:hypothetical protein [Mucilaginibacter jinjuensis]WCT13356.1 hypothetical protein PQO05_05340 [Mucilaginibacter jinjuensis]